MGVTLKQLRAKRTELQTAESMLAAQQILVKELGSKHQAAQLTRDVLYRTHVQLREELERMGQQFALDETEGDGDTTPKLPGIAQIEDCGWRSLESDDVQTYGGKVTPCCCSIVNGLRSACGHHYERREFCDGAAKRVYTNLNNVDDDFSRVLQ